MPAISVIVLNWNGRDYLRACLSSLEKQTFGDFELLLVDNASTDDSVVLVRDQFPWVRLVALDQNYGFCGGNNRGITEATGRYVILLNNDTECHPAFVQALFEAIETHPEVGMCATRMVNSHDRSLIDNCGIGLHAIGIGYQIGSGRADGDLFSRPRYVFGASGGAALYRRAMLDEIGGLDEDYFAYTDDTDLSWRGQMAGYRCLYVPGAIVYHVGSATIRRISGGSLYFIQRNLTWTYLKNMPTVLLVAGLPIHLLYAVYWYLRAARNGQGHIVWKARRDALRGWPSIRAKRRGLQTHRRLSTRSFLKLVDWRRQ